MSHILCPGENSRNIDLAKPSRLWENVGNVLFTLNVKKSYLKMLLYVGRFSLKIYKERDFSSYCKES